MPFSGRPEKNFRALQDTRGCRLIFLHIDDNLGAVLCPESRYILLKSWGKTCKFFVEKSRNLAHNKHWKSRNLPHNKLFRKFNGYFLLNLQRYSTKFGHITHQYSRIFLYFSMIICKLMTTLLWKDLFLFSLLLWTFWLLYLYMLQMNVLVLAIDTKHT